MNMFVLFFPRPLPRSRRGGRIRKQAVCAQLISDLFPFTRSLGIVVSEVSSFPGRRPVRPDKPRQRSPR